MIKKSYILLSYLLFAAPLFGMNSDWNTSIYDTSWNRSYEKCSCEYTVYLGSLAAMAYIAVRSSGIWDGQLLGNLEPSARCECCCCLPALFTSISTLLDEPDPTHSCIWARFNKFRHKLIDLPKQPALPETKKMS